MCAGIPFWHLEPDIAGSYILPGAGRPGARRCNKAEFFLWGENVGILYRLITSYILCSYIFLRDFCCAVIMAKKNPEQPAVGLSSWIGNMFCIDVHQVTENHLLTTSVVVCCGDFLVDIPVFATSCVVLCVPTLFPVWLCSLPFIFSVTCPSPFLGNPSRYFEVIVLPSLVARSLCFFESVSGLGVYLKTLVRTCLPTGLIPCFDRCLWVSDL